METQKKTQAQQKYPDFASLYSSAAETEIDLGRAVQSTCIFIPVPTLQKFSWPTTTNAAFIAV